MPHQFFFLHHTITFFKCTFSHLPMYFFQACLCYTTVFKQYTVSSYWSINSVRSFPHSGLILQSLDQCLAHRRCSKDTYIHLQCILYFWLYEKKLQLKVFSTSIFLNKTMLLVHFSYLIPFVIIFQRLRITFTKIIGLVINIVKWLCQKYTLILSWGSLSFLLKDAL